MSSCASRQYFLRFPDDLPGIDFKNGKCLIGEIDVNKNVKNVLTEKIKESFLPFFKDRLYFATDSQSLLLAKNTPFNPTKSQILDIKGGTGYDFFVNIKCKNSRNDLSKFELIEHSYYIKQMSFAVVTVQIYDLNAGKIIYTQETQGSIMEDDDLTSKPTTVIILGCYDKILENLKKKILF